MSSIHTKNNAKSYADENHENKKVASKHKCFYPLLAQKQNYIV
jgi:hypothetical protein